MTADPVTMLTALALFQLKHFLCDFVLQTPYQWRNKGRYGHPGGLVHVAIHGVATVGVLFVMGAAWPTIALVVAVEAVLHYHIDWLKEQINRRGRLTESDARFWRVLGADQMLHQLCYLAIVWWLVRNAS